MVHRQGPTQHSLTLYIDSHNAYVQQLHATNAMLEAYNCETVPQLLQELEEIYTDLCNIVAEAVLQGAEAISTRVSSYSIILIMTQNLYFLLSKYILFMFILYFQLFSSFIKTASFQIVPIQSPKCHFL